MAICDSRGSPILLIGKGDNNANYSIRTGHSEAGFSLYWVEPETGEVINRKFSRKKLIEFFSNRVSGTVALEACGSAHWWTRTLQSMGHDVKLLNARFIRPFVQIIKQMRQMLRQYGRLQISQTCAQYQ